MPAKTSIAKSAYVPLTEALKRIEFWLERDGASRVIVAEPTTKKLKAQNLPDHVCVIPKKRRGPRKALRGRRHYDEQYLKLAVWPQDRLDENALPSVACCISGEVDLQIADYVLCCRAGDWILFPAGVPKQDGSTPHFEGDPTGRAGEVLWIYTGTTPFDGISCWICCSEGEVHYKPKNSSCRVENRLLAQLFDGFCTETQGARRQEIVQRLLALVLLMLRSEIEAGNASKEVRRLHHHGGSKQKGPITEALDYIDGNLHQHLTISKVARQVLVSPATFTRRFKEQTGDTFQAYQTKRRMEVAEELLRTTNLPVLNVCQRVGLKYGQLWLLFQERHGSSPSEYRASKD